MQQGARDCTVVTSQGKSPINLSLHLKCSSSPVFTSPAAQIQLSILGSHSNTKSEETEG